MSPVQLEFAHIRQSLLWHLLRFLVVYRVFGNIRRGWRIGPVNGL